MARERGREGKGATHLSSCVSVVSWALATLADRQKKASAAQTNANKVERDVDEAPSMFGLEGARAGGGGGEAEART